MQYRFGQKSENSNEYRLELKFFLILFLSVNCTPFVRQYGILNQKWATDVTEFSLFGENLYLSPILDLHSSDLVSYTISDRPVLSMVAAMLDKAFEKISDGIALILHSDQGWQYQHKQYRRMLQEKGIRQSMSRKGNCLDNAVIEISLAFSKVNCFIYNSSIRWSISSRNCLSISITTVIVVS